MATVKFFVSANKQQIAPIYVRVISGRLTDIRAKTGYKIDPKRWSNSRETIKQRILTKDDTKFIDKLENLKTHIKNELMTYSGQLSKDWLINVINHHHNRDTSGDTLNGYITSYIERAEKGEVTNRSNMQIASNTIKVWKSFQRLFNEYQGRYDDDMLAELRKRSEKPRPIKELDYADITIAFADDFKIFLAKHKQGKDVGQTTNTVAKYLKIFKYFMQQSLDDGKHRNRDFQNKKYFNLMPEKTFSIALTPEEIQRIYEVDLSTRPHLDRARDAFVALCETAVRVSDYGKIGSDIQVKDGKKYIHLTTTKTSTKVILPLSHRLETILIKYDGRLPSIPEQIINKRIKVVAAQAGIDEPVSFEIHKGTMKHTRTVKKYELVCCHTGRRSAATALYKSGTPIVDCMAVTGHTSEQTFMNYIKVTKEEIAERLASNPFFQNEHLKAV